MKLYYHADRADVVVPGKVIRLEKTSPLHPLSALAPVIDKEFSEHLSKMCSEGLSRHGLNYLANQDRDNQRLHEFLLEIRLEHIRYTRFSEYPSRFQSFFAFTALDTALRFAGLSGRVYEIEAHGFEFDMSLLQIGNEDRYWAGEQGDRSVKECLIDLRKQDITILRECV